MKNNKKILILVLAILVIISLAIIIIYNIKNNKEDEIYFGDHSFEHDFTTTIKEFDFDVIISDLDLDDEKILILEKEERKYYYANQEFSLYIKSYDNTGNKDVYNKYSFQDVLENNMLSFEDILKKANKSEMYDDGGSTIYFYDDFNIMVCNTLLGNNDIIIGDKTINVNYCE